MGGRVNTRIEFRVSCSDTMINYRLSQKLKLLRNDEFNHLNIVLTGVKGREAIMQKKRAE